MNESERKLYEEVSFQKIETNINNLQKNNLILFIYEFFDEENLEEINEIFLQKIKKINEVLKGIFSENFELKNNGKNIILELNHNIKINFSIKKADRLKNFYIIEIVFENLEVDITEYQKDFLHSFYYLLKDLQGLNINYVDDSFSDILEKDYINGHKCSVGEICEVIDGFKQNILTKDNNRDKYLEIIKILNKKKIKKEDLEKLKNLLSIDFFLEEKDKILEVIKDFNINFDLYVILQKIQNGEELTIEEKEIFYEKYSSFDLEKLKKEKVDFEKLRNEIDYRKKIFKKAFSRSFLLLRIKNNVNELDEYFKKLEKIKQELFEKFKNKLISEQYQELLNFYLDIRNRIFFREELKNKDFTELLENNIVLPKEKIQEILEKNTDELIIGSLTLLINLGERLEKFYFELNTHLQELKNGQREFKTEELNLLEQIILEIEKQAKKIPGFFNKIGYVFHGITQKARDILKLENSIDKNLIENKYKKQQEEILQAKKIFLEILVYLKFLEQKDEENLVDFEGKVREKIQKFKNIYNDNKFIQNLDLFFEKNQDKYGLYVKNFNKEFESLDGENQQEDQEELENFINKKKFFLGDYSEIQNFFEKYQEFESYIFLQENNFLYNEKSKKFYKLLYTRGDFISEQKNGEINDIKKVDNKIKQRVKNYFLILRNNGIIKDLIDLEKNSNDIEKELFEIELLDGKKIKIILKDDNFLVLSVDKEDIGYSLEELFFQINNFLDFNFYNIGNLIPLNFSKKFSNIENKINFLKQGNIFSKNIDRDKEEIFLFSKYVEDPDIYIIKGIYILDNYYLDAFYIPGKKLIKLVKKYINRTEYENYNGETEVYEYLDFNELGLNISTLSFYKIPYLNSKKLKNILKK